MMTVFFYSGITSYPGVSTEEKTIPSSQVLMKQLCVLFSLSTLVCLSIFLILTVGVSNNYD